ncbi:MAG: hypothetical protein AAFX79_08650 [Planctomycetota bacterium]
MTNKPSPTATCIAGLVAGVLLARMPSAWSDQEQLPAEQPETSPVRLEGHIDRANGEQVLRTLHTNLPGTFRDGMTFSLPRNMPTPHGWQVRQAVVLDVVGEWVIIQASSGSGGASLKPMWFRPASHPYLYEAK